MAMFSVSLRMIANLSRWPSSECSSRYKVPPSARVIVLRGEQDLLQQAVDVLVLRECGADLVELLETAKQIFDGVQGAAPRS